MVEQEILTGIELAIKLEQEAQGFYRSRAESVESHVIKKAFEFLAAQEKGHEEALLELKSGLAEKGELPVTQGTVSGLAAPAMSQFFEGEAEKQKHINEGEVSMLLWAMRAERRAEELYKELSEKVTGNEEKRFFASLAEFERGHYNLLDQMIEALTDPADYLQT
jgi:rubrerythrin